jgi:hypothetical protein
MRGQKSKKPSVEPSSPQAAFMKRRNALFLLASPKKLLIYPSCYIRIKNYCKYYEFYPTKRHRKPSVLFKSADL